MPRPVNANRLAAMKTGGRTYDGPPCAAGHTLRHTQSRACVQCQADAQRQRRAAATDIDSLLG